MTGAFTRQSIITQGADSLERTPAGLGVNTLIVNVSLVGDARSGPYYPGPGCKSVMIVTTGACKFQMRGNGSPGTATDLYRDCTMSAEQQTSSATKIGILCATSIPWEFFLFDVSGSTNAVSMYVTYE